MIILKTSKQIKKIKKSCKIVALVLKNIEKKAKPGVTTSYLNKIAETICMNNGGIPGLKNYKGFPYSLCCSKNDVIVHGFPNDIPLRAGDILSVDFTTILNGWWGDSAITIPIGNVSESASELIECTQQCLLNGIDAAKPGNKIGHISEAIHETADKYGFSVVKEFVGHGVGKNLHEKPQVLNYKKNDKGIIIKPGLVLAIEPILCSKKNKFKILDNTWTTKTVDGGLSAHFEHTVAITHGGAEILTNRLL